MKYKQLIFSLLLALIAAPAFSQFTTTFPKPDQAKLTNSKTLNVTQIRQSGHIQVTTPHYDNIGQVLTKLNFKYSNYAPEKSPYMIFMNCGTSTDVGATEISNYVENGGVLYASDLSDETLLRAFPGLFDFAGRHGLVGELSARVEDSELREVIGEEMTVHFDLKGWAKLKGISQGKVLLRDADSGMPLMVEIPYGDGVIFYTCFHNHKQASKQEEALLQLLIAKQVNSILQQDFVVTAEQMGLNLRQMKMVFRE